MIRWLLCLLLLLPCLATAAPLPQPAVAFTFDDLPYGAVASDDDAALANMTTRLVQRLQAGQIPAVGFVNEAKLYRDGELDPARVALLRTWLDAGFELGNHTYSHPSLDQVPLDAFEGDVLKGETVTRPLMHEAGRTLRWFRHPFLDEGTTPEVRATFARFLTAHGYRVAPVTVNSAEWVFAAAYARALAQNDAAAARHIANAYVPYMQAVFAQAEQLALDLFGRPIPQVVVLHANQLNADQVDALAAMLRQRGYRFVSLDEALADPVYAAPPGVTGVEGESWLEGWARQAGLRPPALPPLPGSVRQWAGPAAYSAH